MRWGRLVRQNRAEQWVGRVGLRMALARQSWALAAPTWRRGSRSGSSHARSTARCASGSERSKASSQRAAPRSVSSKTFARERSTPATPHCSTTRRARENCDAAVEWADIEDSQPSVRQTSSERGLARPDIEVHAVKDADA